MSVIRRTLKTILPDFVKIHDDAIAEFTAAGMPTDQAARRAMARCKIEWLKRNPPPVTPPQECAYCGKRKNLIPVPSLGPTVHAHEDCLVYMMSAISDLAEAELREHGLAPA